MKLRQVRHEEHSVEISIDELMMLKPNLEEISAHQIEDLEEWLAAWTAAIARAKSLLAYMRDRGL